MARSAILLTIACLVVLSTANRSFLQTRTSTGTVDPDCVRLYDGTNLSGASVDVCTNITNLSSVSFNNKLTSLELGSNVEVLRVFKNPSYASGTRNFTANRNSMPSGFNNNITSVKVELKRPAWGCVRFFENTEFNGPYADACGNKAKFSNMSFDNKANSLKLGSGVTTVRVWKNNNYKSTNKTYSAHATDLSVDNLGGVISSCKVNTVNIPQGCVRLWDAVDYSGNSVDICNGISNLANESFNNKISSIQFGKSVASVVLYKNNNENGASKTYTGDITDLSGDGFNNNVSSMKVNHEAIGAACVRFYEYTSYRGTFREFCDGNGNLSGQSFDNKPASLKLGSDIISVTVFKNNNRNGDSHTYSANRSNMGSNGFGDNVSSYELEFDFPEPDCVRFYNFSNYGSNFKDFCSDTPYLSSQSFNDKASSIKLGSNVASVTVYVGSNYVGNSETFTENIAALSDYNMKDNISSCRINHN